MFLIFSLVTHGDTSVAHSTRSKRGRHEASSSQQSQVIMEQVSEDDQKQFYSDRKHGLFFFFNFYNFILRF